MSNQQVQRGKTIWYNEEHHKQNVFQVFTILYCTEIYELQSTITII